MGIHLSDEDALAAYNAITETRNAAEAARITGIAVNTLKHRYKVATRRGLHLSEGARDAMASASLSGVEINGGYRHRYDPETGQKLETVRWSVPRQEEELETTLERISKRVECILPAPAVKRPAQTKSDLCNLFPLFDVHLSMKVGSYGTAAAVDRLREGADNVISRAPAAESCIILNGGDWTHQNDNSNQTPRSKHPLPVDEDYETTTDISTDLTVELIFKALKRHDHVTYKALRGNHDPTTALILRAALRQRFRNEPRVTIDDDGIDFFHYSWGGNLICGHHGDIRGKRPSDIAMAFAALNPEGYSRAKHREIHTGHRHHLKSQEMPGWVWYQHRAICPMDRHSMEDLWVSGSEMTGITYHERGARYGQVTHIF